MPGAFHDKAAIDYSYYMQTVQAAAGDMNLIGHMVFFLEQAVEKMLRQVLEDCQISAPLLSQVPELALQLKKALPHLNNKDIDDLTGDLGLQIASWDLSGRYSTGFMPDIDSIDRAEKIYGDLITLDAMLVAKAAERERSEYTDHFKQFASQRA